jgi:hypothetical protein
LSTSISTTCSLSSHRADTDGTECRAVRCPNTAPVTLDRHPTKAKNSYASEAPNPGDIIS